MIVKQKDIVFINFELPNGQYKPHPALIISNDDINEYEDRLIVVMLSTTPMNDDYTFLLTNEMFNFNPRLKTPKHLPQIRCHLVIAVEPLEVVKRFGSMKKEYFCQVIDQMRHIIFSC